MKKTLLLTHEYYPFKGGVARYVYNLFKNFDKDDYIVVSDHKEVKTMGNVVNMKLTYNFLKPSWLISYFKIKRLIKKNNIEVLLTPNILPLGSMCYFLGIPYVISLHGLDINLALKNKPKLAKKILQRADKIIVNTENTANIIKPLDIPKEKIELIYPTIDFKASTNKDKLQKLKQSMDIDDSSRVLLTVGRLNKRKGQDLVIEIVNKLKEDFNIKYLIIGCGDFKKDLFKKINDYELEDRVFVLCDVDDYNLPYYYQMADIFVLPHREDKVDIEGFGIVFLEAASSKLPIVAGTSGGVQEILTNQKNALLVDDYDQLLAAVKQLLNNPTEADKLAEQAFLRSLEFNKPAEQSKLLRQILS
jgi:phosphatidylinositol alpha-1,6-mannosyltransferase